jgi:hypothetical protein
MPSRRTVLAAASALGASAGVGWLLTGGSHTGRVMLKRIDVSWDDGGAVRNGYLLRSLLGPSEEGVLSYDPAYVGAALADPVRITVDERLHDRLADRFRDVEYLVGVCGTAPGEGCSFEAKPAGRTAFNRLRLGAASTVVDPGDALFVLEADASTEAAPSVDVSEFDFDEETFDFDARNDYRA